MFLDIFSESETDVDPLMYITKNFRDVLERRSKCENFSYSGKSHSNNIDIKVLIDGVFDISY